MCSQRCLFGSFDQQRKTLARNDSDRVALGYASEICTFGIPSFASDHYAAFFVTAEITDRFADNASDFAGLYGDSGW